MIQLDEQMTLAEIVLQHPACAAVLHRYHLEFCCSGPMPLALAVEEQGLDLAEVMQQLRQTVASWGEAPGIDARAATTPSLLHHLVTRHHRVVREALPSVVALARKVARVHGDHNPNLVLLRDSVAELADRLVPHLDEDEQVLFPALEREAVSAEALAIANEEHGEFGRLLHELRAHAENFSVPDWGCNSYRTLMSQLRSLDEEIAAHVHLERNVLLPRFAPQAG